MGSRGRTMATTIREFVRLKGVTELIDDIHRQEFPSDDHGNIYMSIDATALYIETFMDVTKHVGTDEDEVKRKELERNVALIEYIMMPSFSKMDIRDRLSALVRCGVRFGSIFVYRHVNDV
jgi:hypothetical protein